MKCTVPCRGCFLVHSSLMSRPCPDHVQTPPDWTMCQPRSEDSHLCRPVSSQPPWLPNLRRRQLQNYANGHSPTSLHWLARILPIFTHSCLFLSIVIYMYIYIHCCLLMSIHFYIFRSIITYFCPSLSISVYKCLPISFHQYLFLSIITYFCQSLPISANHYLFLCKWMWWKGLVQCYLFLPIITYFCALLPFFCPSLPIFVHHYLGWPIITYFCPSLPISSHN